MGFLSEVHKSKSSECCCCTEEKHTSSRRVHFFARNTCKNTCKISQGLLMIGEVLCHFYFRWTRLIQDIDFEKTTGLFLQIKAFIRGFLQKWMVQISGLCFPRGKKLIYIFSQLHLHAQNDEKTPGELIKH